MTQSVGDNPARTLTFGRFVLDTKRGCLLSDAREIPLRPPTFAILACLAQRAGQGVPVDDLLEAGWPGLVVTEDTLAQSIAELRRVLGDAEGRLIAATPGPGYRLDVMSAPPERRHATGIRAMRWRWMYGLLAPLALALALAAIWLATSCSGSSPPATMTPKPAPDSAMLAGHENHRLDSLVLGDLAAVRAVDGGRRARRLA